MENLEDKRLAAIVFADVVSHSRLFKKWIKKINSFETHKLELFDPRRKIGNEINEISTKLKSTIDMVYN